MGHAGVDRSLPVQVDADSVVCVDVGCGDVVVEEVALRCVVGVMEGVVGEGHLEHCARTVSSAGEQTWNGTWASAQM